MSCFITISVQLGTDYNGASLGAKLTDINGNASAVISTGFIDFGGGNFLFNTSVDCGFRGACTFFVLSDTNTVLAMTSISPNDLVIENPGISINVGHSEAPYAVIPDKQNWPQSDITITTGVKKA